MSLRAQLARFLSVGAMRIVTALLALALFWYIARLRGVQALGEFSLVMSIYGFFQQLPMLGLHLLVIREVAGSPSTAARHVVNGAVSAMCVGALLAVAIGGGAHFHSTSMSAPLALMAIALVPTALINVLESVLIGQQRMHLYAGVNMVESCLRTLFSLAALHYGFGLTALMAIFLCSRLLAAAAYIVAGRFWTVALQSRIELAVLRHYLRSAPVLLGGLLLTAALGRFDVFFLAALGSLTDVGMYSAPFKVYEVALMAPSIIAVVLYPMFAAARSQSPNRLAELTVGSMRLLFLAGAPCAVAVGLLAVPLIRAAFGPEYVDAAPVLQLLIGCSVAVGLSQVLALNLLVANRQDLDLAALGISAAFYAIALAAMIPLWGYVGAALATVLTVLVQLAARYYFVLTRLGLVRIERRSFKPLLAAAVMVAVAIVARHGDPALALFLGIATYGLCLVALKAVGAADYAVIRGLLQPTASRTP